MNAPNGDSQVLVDIQSLGVRIDGHWLLRGLDLQVQAGETLAIIGASGSGKSLLLRHILGLATPNEGGVEVLGERLDGVNRRRMRQIGRNLGILYQNGALFSSLSVFDNIAFPIRELRRDGQQVSEALVAAMVSMKLAAVGLETDVAWQMPDALSGGMVKRVALARALILDPRLLFLDEPTTGLDPAAVTEFHQLYNRLHRAMGQTGLIVTHDHTTLTAMADRIAVLADGQIIAQGSLETIRQTSHPFIERFFANDTACSDRDE